MLMSICGQSQKVLRERNWVDDVSQRCKVIRPDGSVCGHYYTSHCCDDAVDEERIIEVVTERVRKVLQGEFSPVSGLHTPPPGPLSNPFVAGNFNSPPTSIYDQYFEYKKYAERLQAALKKKGRETRMKYKLRFDRLEGILDFSILEGADEPHYTLKIKNAAHLKNVYVAFTVQFATDVDTWAMAFKDNSFMDCSAIATP